LITDEQVEHFLKNGYIRIKGAFTQEQANEFMSSMWIRLGMDPNDKSTWDKERVHMPFRERVKVSSFAPKVKTLIDIENKMIPTNTIIDRC
jgi:hypothetical protein